MTIDVMRILIRMSVMMVVVTSMIMAMIAITIIIVIVMSITTVVVIVMRLVCILVLQPAADPAGRRPTRSPSSSTASRHGPNAADR